MPTMGGLLRKKRKAGRGEELNATLELEVFDDFDSRLTGSIREFDAQQLEELGHGRETVNIFSIWEEESSSSTPFSRPVSSSASAEASNKKTIRTRERKLKDRGGHGQAGVYARLVNSWVGPLIRLGTVRHLTQQDLPDLPEFMSVGKTLADTKKNLRGSEYGRLAAGPDRESGKSSADVPIGVGIRVGLLHTLYSVCWWDTIAAVGSLWMKSICQLSQPWIIRCSVLWFTGVPSDHWFMVPPGHPMVPSDHWPEGRDRHHIVALAFLMFATLCGESWCTQTSLCELAGLRQRAVVSSLIFQKALRLHPNANRYTDSELVDMIAVDAQRFYDFQTGGGLKILAIIPTLVVAVVLLHYLIEDTVWPGLVVLCLALPINAWLNSRQKWLREEQVDLAHRRFGLVHESIKGIHGIKYHSYADLLAKRVAEIRQEELQWLRSQKYTAAIQLCFNYLSPTLALTVVFFSADGRNDARMAAPTVFAVVPLFYTVRQHLRWLPNAISISKKMRDTLVRLQNFFELPERVELQAGFSTETGYARTPRSETDRGGEFRIEKAVFSRDASAVFSTDKSAPVALSVPRILKVEPGCLVAVVGSAGSGKSTLLGGIMGEMQLLAGTVHLSGSVAYCGQRPWLFSGTLQDNILCGNPYHKEKDKDRYEQILCQCDLKRDLELLPKRDKCVIGKNGSPLSEAQMMRVSLARAVYSNAQVVLLDDVLSGSTDTVAAHIWSECIKGALQGRTRVIVTNNMQFIKDCDQIVHIDQGVLLHCINFKTFAAMHSVGSIPSIGCKSGGPRLRSASPSLEEDKKKRRTEFLLQSSAPEIDEEEDDTDEEAAPVYDPEATMSINISRGGASSTPGLIKTANNVFDGPIAAQDNSDQLNSLYVGWGTRMTMRYLNAGFPILVVFAMLIFGFMGAQLMVAGTKVSLANWSELAQSCDEKDKAISSTNNVTEQNLVANQEKPLCANREWYFIFAMGALGPILARSLLWAALSVRASRTLHQQLFNSVLSMSMPFFQDTPKEAVMKRFTDDMDQIDYVVSASTSNAIDFILHAIACIAIIVIIIPYSAVPIAVAILLYYRLTKQYRRINRELNDLSETTAQPILEHFKLTLTGLTTLGAFGDVATVRQARENMQLLDLQVLTEYTCITCSSWMRLGLDLLSAVMSFAIFCILIASYPDGSTLDTRSDHRWLLWMDIGPASAGLVLAILVQLVYTCQVFAKLSTGLEAAMHSIQDVTNIIDQESKAADRLSSDPTSFVFPVGDIVFERVSMRLRPDLPPTLSGLSFTVLPGERFSICGGTQLEQSSIAMCLFRLVDLCMGKIVIDGQDISELGLSTLREALAIVPLEPLCFRGTIRENIDPHGRFGREGDEEDYAIEAAVDQSYLGVWLRETDAKSGRTIRTNGLDTKVEAGGSNLSIGLRRQICLARALIRRLKVTAVDYWQVLVVEESTASGSEADHALMQQAVGGAGLIQDGRKATTIMVTDRVKTIMESTNVAVLENGHVAECGQPQQLRTRSGPLVKLFGREMDELQDRDGGGDDGGGSGDMVHLNRRRQFLLTDEPEPESFHDIYAGRRKLTLLVMENEFVALSRKLIVCGDTLDDILSTVLEEVGTAPTMDLVITKPADGDSLPELIHSIEDLDDKDRIQLWPRSMFGTLPVEETDEDRKQKRRQFLISSDSDRAPINARGTVTIATQEAGAPLPSREQRRLKLLLIENEHVRPSRKLIVRGRTLDEVLSSVLQQVELASNEGTAGSGVGALVLVRPSNASSGDMRNALTRPVVLQSIDELGDTDRIQLWPRDDGLPTIDSVASAAVASAVTPQREYMRPRLDTAGYAALESAADGLRDIMSRPPGDTTDVDDE